MSYREGKKIGNSLMKTGKAVSGALDKQKKPKNPTKQRPGQSTTKRKNYNAATKKPKQTTNKKTQHKKNQNKKDKNNNGSFLY